MIELIYQKWYFKRPLLTDRIMALLMEGAGDPLALVGERRIGKTSHLLFELIPLATRRGMVPVYIDVYQHRANPLAAVNYALQEALDDLEVPVSKVGKRFKTAVKKIGVAGASLELGDEPARKRPDDPFLLVDWLLKVLVRTAQKPVLLIFDEVQELATVADGENIVSAIRSALTKSKNNVRVVFTGSSQQKLLELFSRSRAALYEGASTLAFPYLGADFINYISQRSKERFKKLIPLSELTSAFERLHYQPRALIDLVLLFSSSEEESLTSVLDERVEAQLTGDQYGTHWSSLRPLQQRICLRVACGEDVTSLEARREYAVGTNREDISPGTINSALRAMVGSHVLTKLLTGRGRYQIDDPLFAEWMRRESARLAPNSVAIKRSRPNRPKRPRVRGRN